MRELHLFLTDKLVASRGNLFEQRGAFHDGHFRRAIRAAGEREGRAQHDFFEVLAHVAEFASLPAPPDRDGRQKQFLVEQMAGEAGQEGEEGRAFHQAAAERVDHGDAAGARGFDQTRHAEQRVAAHLQRIAEGVRHAAQNYIHFAQAFERLHEDAAVAHGEILAFDEREAEQARAIGVLEVGFVAGAGREQDDGGIL